MRRLVLSLAFARLPAVAAVVLGGCRAADPGPRWTVTAGPFDAVLMDRGEVGSLHEAPLSAALSTKVDTLIPEGTMVKPGDLVVTLDGEQANDQWERARLLAEQRAVQVPQAAEKGRLDVWRLGLERRNAELDLAIAKARFRGLAEGRDGAAIVDAAQAVGAMRAQRATIARTLPEAKGLAQRGYIADAELAALQRKLAELDARLAATRVRLHTLEAGPRAEELGLERLHVEAAAAALAGAQERLHAGTLAAKLDLEGATRARKLAVEAERYRRTLRDATKLVAPAAGVVIYREIWTGNSFAKIKPGDAVDEGTALATIADPASPIVRANVDDAAAARLTLGLPVRATFDAYPGLVLAGKVAAIAAIGGPRLDGDLAKLVAVEVKVALEHPEPRLRPGMSANLSFVLEHREGALAVPSQAIGHDAAGAFVRVWVPRQGWHAADWQRRAVTTGPSNEQQTVITAGLAAGDQIALAGGAP